MRKKKRFGLSASEKGQTFLYDMFICSLDETVNTLLSTALIAILVDVLKKCVSRTSSVANEQRSGVGRFLR